MQEKPRASAPIWYWLSEEQRAELQRRFPGMSPPLPPEVELEAIEEIEREIQRKPKGQYAAYIAGKK